MVDIINIIKSIEEERIDSLEFSINNYSIFGTHLNIEGCIDSKLEDPKLILKNKDKMINLFKFSINFTINISKLRIIILHIIYKKLDLYIL